MNNLLFECVPSRIFFTSATRTHCAPRGNEGGVGGVGGVLVVVRCGDGDGVDESGGERETLLPPLLSVLNVCA